MKTEDALKVLVDVGNAYIKKGCEPNEARLILQAIDTFVKPVNENTTPSTEQQVDNTEKAGKSKK